MGGEFSRLKKQHYLEAIRECTHSGKPKRQWCNENGISYSTYMRWQRQLRNEAAGQIMEQQSIVPVKISSLPLPVCRQGANSEQEICIQKGEVSIRLSGSLPSEYVLAIIRGIF